jgi:hypothetical protein
LSERSAGSSIGIATGVRGVARQELRVEADALAPEDQNGRLRVGDVLEEALGPRREQVGRAQRRQRAFERRPVRPDAGLDAGQ